MRIAVRYYTKIRVLLYLNEAATAKDEYCMGEGWAWRAPATIANDTGTNIGSLYVLLKRWRTQAWGYATGKHFEASQMADKRAHWLYRINRRGVSYLERLPRWYNYEALAEIKAELAEYDRATIVFSALKPLCIGWRTLPSKYFILLNWPFESRGDVDESLRRPHGYEVENIEQAMGMAEIIFDIKPSQECLSYAKALEVYQVKEALHKLSTNVK